ncbi:hypothetical protein TKV_c11270 [Thermoanaerobacter kivui]|uniref:Bypass of forespore C C-terminal domain-containing protein n=1 Tax=Thermoanaerobacter kivui TaxID=2325 RepID=A0A097AR58_THEKI|nr:hypothetical protein [Thermoanaerobacter kivui]AIS52299.1 hypothetical protein TKV_c11270 [Thermoanaerobacter kivui]
MKKLFSNKMVAIYLIAIAIGVGIGYLYNVKNNERQNQDRKVIYEEKIPYQQDVLAKKMIPRSKLIFETKYLENGEVVREVQTLNPSLYGKSREEIAKIYSDWEIKSFNDEEIVLYREKRGLPADYYIISSINGYVVLLKSDGNGGKEIVEKTDIPLESLTPFDRERVMKNIIVKDKDEAYQILANLSS